MRVSLMVLVLVLICVEGYSASTYIKASNEKIRVIETIERTTETTVAELKHEIDGVDKDLATIEAQYLTVRENFLKRKMALTEALEQCDTLGIAEPKPIVKEYEPNVTIPTEHTL